MIPFVTCPDCGAQSLEEPHDHARDATRHEPPAPAAGYTVKQADIFGNVIDTYQTEGELNGWRAKQGMLL